jgi:Integrase core domain.
VALFICLATRAIHLELVSDYTAQDFLAAFRRFVARRGLCACLYSDNGTNFHGAYAELKALFQRTTKEHEEIAALLANDGIDWKFNPPSAPHFGGIWEAGVKSMKHHLIRLLKDKTMTFEELSTALAQIEACLNSRPLSAISDDPDDFAALTPGHFLIGSVLTSVPEPSTLDLNCSHLTRWLLVRNVFDHFWQRWRQEYLHTLQQRTKWRSSSVPAQVNQLVVIKDDNLPPGKWNLGRIIKVHPGADGQVRVVTLRTQRGTLTRPVIKICMLPVETREA